MKTNIPALYRSEGYRVESIHVSETFGQVEMRWDNRFKPKHSACGGTMRICRKTFQMAIDMPLACNQATHLRYEAVQGFCGKCGMSETVRPLGIPPNGKTTLRFMRHVNNLCRFIPASRVCEVIGLSGSSAWRYDRYILASELPPPSLDGVEALLIDEKHIGRKGGFVTVVLNAKTGELLHLGEGKGAEALEPFFAGLSEAQRSGILAVGIDRSNAYKAAVEAHLPNAEIVFDKFHVVANYNDVIDKVRRRSLAKANGQGRAFIKGQRYNLFRNPEKLSESGRQSLAMLLEANEEIWAAYVLKDGLTGC